MKIKDILAKGQPTLSFEVFPPKEESNFASVEKAALEIAKLNPSLDRKSTRLNSSHIL